MRTERGAKGAVAFHCGMRDAAAWAGSFSKLAAKDVRVLAAGNILSFSRGGRAVRVVMHPVAA